MLVDDPRRWFDVQQAFAIGAWRECRLTIVATDLAQVENVVSDQELKIFLKGQVVVRRNLTQCYRQTKGVGRTSIALLHHISERFTKHIHQDRIDDFARRHQLSIETANAMKLVRDGGYSQVYETFTTEDVAAELQAIVESELWEHTTPICIVVEGAAAIDRRAFAGLGRNTVLVDLHDVEEIRGVEFQHVLVFLTGRTLHELLVSGRNGLSTDEYLAARNLRIPFSRATDRLVLFGGHT